MSRSIFLCTISPFSNNSQPGPHPYSAYMMVLPLLSWLNLILQAIEGKTYLVSFQVVPTLRPARARDPPLIPVSELVPEVVSNKPRPRIWRKRDGSPGPRRESVGLEGTCLKRMRLILRRGGERVLSLSHSSSTSNTGTDAEPLLPLHVLSQWLLYDNVTPDIPSNYSFLHLRPIRIARRQPPYPPRPSF